MADAITTDILQVDPLGLRPILRQSIKQKRALMIWGEPGIAKSEMVAQETDDLGGVLIPIHLSQFDSVDLRGIPTIGETKTGGRMTVWQPPKILPFLGNPDFSAEKLIVIFLDELPQAMHAVQAPAMQLVLEKRIGEHKLMPNVAVIAAGNLESHKSGSNSMLAALRNRFRHVQLQTSIKAWCDWAHKTGINPKLIAFLRFRADNLTTFQSKDGVVTTQKAFATPRTWEWVSKTLNDPSISEDLRLQLNTGDVGPGPAGELEGFLRLFDKMPDPQDLFNNPEKADVPKDDSAMMYAISAAISTHCTTAPLLKKITPYISRMPVEYGVRTIQDILLRTQKLANTKEFNEFAAKHQNLFEG